MYLFLPPVYMQLFGFTGLESILACLPTADFASICVTVFFMVHEVRKVRRWRDDAVAAGEPVDQLPADFAAFPGAAPAGAPSAGAGASGACEHSDAGAPGADEHAGALGGVPSCSCATAVSAS